MNELTWNTIERICKEKKLHQGLNFKHFIFRPMVCSSTIFISGPRYAIFISTYYFKKISFYCSGLDLFRDCIFLLVHITIVKTPLYPKTVLVLYSFNRIEDEDIILRNFKPKLICSNGQLLVMEYTSLMIKNVTEVSAQ